MLRLNDTTKLYDYNIVLALSNEICKGGPDSARATAARRQTAGRA